MESTKGQSYTNLLLSEKIVVVSMVFVNLMKITDSRIFVLSLMAFTLVFPGKTAAQLSQPSIAHVWINQALFSIRNDFARPPVHARNLFHLSTVMHDAWAALEPGKNTYFLGQQLHGVAIPFEGFPIPSDSTLRVGQQKEALSFAAYRLLKHRFFQAPGVFFIYQRADSIMNANGYDINLTSTNYLQDGPAALGNYIAEQMISYGLQDGSNESNNYDYQYYEPANPPIEVELPGNPEMIDPNRWQAISLSNSIDQAGNPVGNTPLHLGPEWGNVNTFGLSPNDITLHYRDGFPYQVYHDPLSPPLLDTLTQTGLEDFYKWNFLMVSVWQSHLDPDNPEVWDISPNNLGNITDYPQNWSDYDTFYDFFNGGDTGQGYAINPVTNLPYTPQLVKRGDYARILAEFWADGIDSETPPGHWFEIYSTISQHPLFERKWKGVGPELSELEYDLNAYFTLGAAMHDAAISAWSVKGWYDYPRPVSTLRYMAEKGQSTDPMLPNYHPAGLPIIPGFVELVEAGDPLVGAMNEHLNKIKLYTWRGPDYISDPETDYAGVGWILAENWWPYQRPSFVTPPFAGYVSGHSTYSRAAADVLTFITGSLYFPGGIGEFEAPMNDFLEFEQGPSTNVILQWATYRDASDQCSLSRIWGGIHPPIDDIPGRKIGELVSASTCLLADSILTTPAPRITNIVSNMSTINQENIGQLFQCYINFDSPMDMNVIPEINFPVDTIMATALSFSSGNWLNQNTYLSSYIVNSTETEFIRPMIQVLNGNSIQGVEMLPVLFDSVFVLDTKSPVLDSVFCSRTVINQTTGEDPLNCTFYFSEPVLDENLVINFSSSQNQTTFSPVNMNWISTNELQVEFNVSNLTPSSDSVFVNFSGITDLSGNPIESNFAHFIDVNTILPSIESIICSTDTLNILNEGENSFSIELLFSKKMDTTQFPQLQFNGLSEIQFNQNSSIWLSDSSALLIFDIQLNSNVPAQSLDLTLLAAEDYFGNILVVPNQIYELLIDTERPVVIASQPSSSEVGINAFLSQDLNIVFDFSEAMNEATLPLVTLEAGGTPVLNVNYNPFESYWINSGQFFAKFNLPALPIDVVEVSATVQYGTDLLGNQLEPFQSPPLFSIFYDPNELSLTSNEYDSFSLFPNPIFSGVNVTMSWSETIQLIDIKLINTIGKEIHIEFHSLDDKQIKFSTKDIPAGNYMIQIHASTKVEFHQLIIL